MNTREIVKPQLIKPRPFPNKDRRHSVDRSKLTDIQKAMLDVWQHQPGADLVAQDIIAEYIAPATQRACALALASIDGRNSRWPHSLQHARVLTAVLTTTPTEEFSHLELRGALSAAAGDLGARLYRDPAGILSGCKPDSEIAKIIRSVHYTDNMGRKQMRCIIDIGPPCDGMHGATVGSVLLGKLVAAVLCSPHVNARRLALSGLVADFSGLLNSPGPIWP